MKVLKFGGTSVANASNIKKTVAIVSKACAVHKTVVVVSALSGVTDKLIHTANAAAVGDKEFRTTLAHLEQMHLDAVKELLPTAQQSGTLSAVKQLFIELEALLEGVFVLQELSLRSKDRIMSFGEVLSSTIISAHMHAENIAHAWADSRKLIRTNSNFGNASARLDETQQLVSAFWEKNNQNCLIFPGFIGSDNEGNITTLGRGGSDYSGAILASALRASELEIWTDVSGMMTADPRICSNAKVVPIISYQEAMELSHFGAKVIYPPTIQPVMHLNIPVRIKNTFAPEDEGTVIHNTASQTAQMVCGLSSINKISLLLLEGSGMVGIPGFSKRLFDSLAKEKINVILITQSSSEHSICVAIDEANTSKAKMAVDEEFAFEIQNGKLEPLFVEQDLAIVALVGDNMKSHPGISGRMFSALGKNGVNIRAIAQGSSEKNISAVIRATDVRKAVNILHEAFFETTKKQLNLFIVGVGNVGSRLLAQLEKQRSFLENQLRTTINVVGLANSKKMLLNEEGIDLNHWKDALSNGATIDHQQLVSFVIEKNLRNSIFIDNTGNAEVTLCYEPLLAKSIAVVACNKIAASSSFSRYTELKHLAREFNTSFLFETNVGAGLPVIATLNDLRNTGDEVTRIQAVLSGTLNFVFNHYDGSRTFAEVVRQAQEEGYTEPDPRLDLGGTDVMRKILILAREAGIKMEMEDITNHGFLPQSCYEGDVTNFYLELAKHEEHFKSLYNEAKANNCRLKFVASLDEGKASVGLKHIDPAHDLYHLYGKDNIVLFYSRRYTDQPLVIKGAGAGAEVTASGIFADIMRVAAEH